MPLTERTCRRLLPAAQRFQLPCQQCHHDPTRRHLPRRHGASHDRPARRSWWVLHRALHQGRAQLHNSQLPSPEAEWPTCPCAPAAGSATKPSTPIGIPTTSSKPSAAGATPATSPRPTATSGTASSSVSSCPDVQAVLDRVRLGGREPAPPLGELSYDGRDPMHVTTDWGRVAAQAASTADQQAEPAARPRCLPPRCRSTTRTAPSTAPRR